MTDDGNDPPAIDTFTTTVLLYELGPLNLLIQLIQIRFIRFDSMSKKKALMNRNFTYRIKIFFLIMDDGSEKGPMIKRSQS